ncbi:hypothetical protein ZWY2020_051330 [Hordeum vulgare]|nr:hypothetical protein ZWY2020_051330 [Hordeum vulgare]
MDYQVSNPVRSPCFSCVGRDPELPSLWRSFVDLISPYTKFHSPLSHSSELVSRAFRHFWRLSLSTRFTASCPSPDHSEEHLPPSVMIAHSAKELYKRHCPSSLTRYCWIGLSPIVQDSPLLPRGSPGRLDPVWLIIRKDQLSIIGLVSLYDQLPNTTQLIKQRF